MPSTLLLLRLSTIDSKDFLRTHVPLLHVPLHHLGAAVDRVLVETVVRVAAIVKVVRIVVFGLGVRVDSHGEVDMEGGGVAVTAVAHPGHGHRRGGRHPVGCARGCDLYLVQLRPDHNLRVRQLPTDGDRDLVFTALAELGHVPDTDGHDAAPRSTTPSTTNPSHVRFM
eukprot:6677133-Prymnesium_polylepis.1